MMIAKCKNVTNSSRVNEASAFYFVSPFIASAGTNLASAITAIHFASIFGVVIIFKSVSGLQRSPKLLCSLVLGITHFQHIKLFGFAVHRVRIIYSISQHSLSFVFIVYIPLLVLSLNQVLKLVPLLSILFPSVKICHRLRQWFGGV